MDILQLPALIQQQQKIKVTDKKTNTPRVPSMILIPATDAVANPDIPIQHKSNCPLRSPQSRNVRKLISFDKHRKSWNFQACY